MTSPNSPSPPSSSPNSSFTQTFQRAAKALVTYLASSSFLNLIPKANASLSEGLIASYPFNGNANDASGNANHGVVHSAAFAADRFGNLNSAYSFDGSSSYIEIVNGSPFNFVNDFSISTWINPASSQGVNRDMFDKSGAPSGWYLRQGITNNNFGFGYFVTPNNDYGPCSIQLLSNIWNHLAITKKDITTHCYLNNILVGTGNASTTSIASNSNLPLIIGARNAGYTQPASAVTQFYKGLLDDIKIYNRTLSRSEVSQLYFAANPISRKSAFAVYSASANNIIPNSVSANADGSFNIAGYAYDSYTDKSFLGKLNSNGQKEWFYEHTSSSYPKIRLYSTAVMDGALYAGGIAYANSSGNAYISKNSLANGTLLSAWILPGFYTQITSIFPTANHTLTCFGSGGASFILKFQPDQGVVTSGNFIFPPGSGVLTSVAAMSDNSYLIGGYTSANPNQGWLSKINYNGIAGSSIWTRLYSSSISTLITSIAEKNNIVIFSGDVNNDGFIGCLNGTTGKSNWLTSIGGSNTDHLAGVAFKSNRLNNANEIMAAGYTTSGTMDSGAAAWYVLMNLNNGTLRKSVVLDGSSNEQAQNIMANNDETFTSLGYTVSSGNSMASVMFTTLYGNGQLDSSILPSWISYSDNSHNMIAGGQNITSAASSITFSSLSLAASKITSALSVLSDPINTVWQQVATEHPTSQPSSQPTRLPSSQPSRQPTRQPSSQPSFQPTTQPTSFISGSLKQGLVAYWPFDGNARDQSGNGNNGVVHSAMLTADRFGIAGRAYRFDGSSSYIEIVSGSPFDFLNFFSVAFWINSAASQNDWTTILSKSFMTNGGSSWLIVQNHSSLNRFFFQYKQSIPDSWASSSETGLVANQWNHYSITKDWSEVRSYLNGNLASVSYGTYPDIKTNGNLPLFIGAADAINGYYFNGLLDDIFIYNRVLTAQEVLSLSQFGAPTSQPSSQPFRLPSSQPTSLPSRLPSGQPSTQPTSQPILTPTGQPSQKPTAQPIDRPSGQPTGFPSNQPTRRPTSQPSRQPVGWPTLQPFGFPTVIPTVQPTSQPSTQPSGQPNSQPSAQPNGNPTSQPSDDPTVQPTDQPSSQPSSQLSEQPSTQPSSQPNGNPTSQPSAQPKDQPSTQPSQQPTDKPSNQPSSQPSRQPTARPTTQPLAWPTGQPTRRPSVFPSSWPTLIPTCFPSSQPSSLPSGQSTSLPTTQPSDLPSSQPTIQPTLLPTDQPSSQPRGQPSSQPTIQSTSQPTSLPTMVPSSQPSGQPRSLPSSQPTDQPNSQPSHDPTSQPIAQPSLTPSSQPTGLPSAQPTQEPSDQPTSLPTTQPTDQPSSVPTAQPTTLPTEQPSVQPSSQPSALPSSLPSVQPSLNPSAQPTTQPSSLPTIQPSSQPSNDPTSKPTVQPTSLPTAQPSIQPTGQPSVLPSSQPNANPSSQPTTQPSISPTSQPNQNPSSSPTTRPTSYPTAKKQSLLQGWLSLLGPESSIHKIVSLNKGELLTAGKENPASAFHFNASNGALFGKYTFPWDFTKAVFINPKPYNSIGFLGSKDFSSTIASCHLANQKLNCDTILQPGVVYESASFHPRYNLPIALGRDALNRTIATFFNPTLASAATYSFTLPAIESLPCMALSASSGSSFIAGLGTDAQGKQNIATGLFSLTPSPNIGKMALLRPSSNSTIQNKENLINAATLMPDSLDPIIAGGIDLGKGLQPYLVRLSSSLEKIVCAKQFSASGSFSDLFFSSTQLYALGNILSKKGNTIQSSLNIARINPATCELLSPQIQVTGPGNITCSQGTPTSTGFLLACNLNQDQALLFSTDKNLTFNNLPSGFRQQRGQSDSLLHSEQSSCNGLAPNVVNCRTDPFAAQDLNLTITSLLATPLKGSFFYPAASKASFSLATESFSQVLPESSAHYAPLPTSVPRIAPTRLPTAPPTFLKTAVPTVTPSEIPSPHPTISSLPTSSPSSSQPTGTYRPSYLPSFLPTRLPTSQPTSSPSLQPRSFPTQSPNTFPTLTPTLAKTKPPTVRPSHIPTLRPTQRPSYPKTFKPTFQPSSFPTFPEELPKNASSSSFFGKPSAGWTFNFESFSNAFGNRQVFVPIIGFVAANAAAFIAIRARLKARNAAVTLLKKAELEKSIPVQDEDLSGLSHSWELSSLSGSWRLSPSHSQNSSSLPSAFHDLEGGSSNHSLKKTSDGSISIDPNQSSWEFSLSSNYSEDSSGSESFHSKKQDTLNPMSNSWDLSLENSSNSSVQDRR